jgi:hypothetical protein
MGAVTLESDLPVRNKEVTDTTGPEDVVAVRIVALADTGVLFVARGIVTPGDVDRRLEGRAVG